MPSVAFFDQVLKPQFQALENGFTFNGEQYIGGLLFYRGDSVEQAKLAGLRSPCSQMPSKYTRRLRDDFGTLLSPESIHVAMKVIRHLRQKGTPGAKAIELALLKYYGLELVRIRCVSIRCSSHLPYVV